MKAFFPDPAPPGSPEYLAAWYVYNAVADGMEPEEAIERAMRKYGLKDMELLEGA